MRTLARGHTLLELLTALSIAALCAALATPSFGALAADLRLSRASNALLGALQYARLQALTRGVTVVLCQSADGSRCLTQAGIAHGWLVFVDAQTGSPIQRDAADELLAQQSLPDDVQLSGTRLALSYWPAARAGTTATLTLCAVPARAAPRAVIVSQSGRPRTSRSGASGKALSCTI
ncbi:MAG: GspH/FimT family pseudopilin [Steroidobacteraceae bacterium]